MNLSEYFDSGEYADFVLIDEDVYLIPPGYKLSRSPREKRNAVVMADGHTREDIIRRWEKFSFSYETILEDALTHINLIVNRAPGAAKILYLRKQHPASPTDYDTAVIDVISPVKSKYDARGPLFASSGVTLEME
ncbi:MAG: hypothetical protein LBI86_08125 [Treponema sp.]|jgi:hypothetical protein|nr:hypothetical protein [Treponema sp.]